MFQQIQIKIDEDFPDHPGRPGLVGGSLPRQFYRGTEPGETKRIKTGNNFWDSLLFVADNEKSALSYGSKVVKVLAKPDAKILYQGTKDFVRLGGNRTKGFSMLQWASSVASRAKEAGYDAVWYKLQGTIGTAIINRAKFEFVAKESIQISIDEDFPGHRGVPGHQGGSLPKGSEVAPSSRGFEGTAYHGGKAGGDIIYFTTDKEAAKSYVDMYNDRVGEGGAIHTAIVSIKNPAPLSVIYTVARSVGIDNESYTPASHFDGNLHGNHEVKKLRNRLRMQGYDGAILKDIAYGREKEFDAIIPFGKVKWIKESIQINIDEDFPDHAGRPGEVGGSLPRRIGASIAAGKSEYARSAGIAYPKAVGVTVPKLRPGEIYLVRYSKDWQGVGGHWAYGGIHLDDVINSTQAYAKGNTTLGYLAIGRFKPDEKWTASLADESNGIEVNGMLGTKYAPFDLLINLKTGQVARHRLKESIQINIDEDFTGHRGIPGHQGGSAPRSQGFSSTMSGQIAKFQKQAADIKAKYKKGSSPLARLVSRRKSELAKQSHVPIDAAKRQQATAHEASIARLVGGQNIGDNAPFDVVVGKNVIEVKAIITGNNPKITMHPESLARKVAYARKNKVKAHTVVVDARGPVPRYYYKAGVGSYRLAGMQEISVHGLKSMVEAMQFDESYPGHPGRKGEVGGSLPRTVYHSTYPERVSSIVKQGILPGKYSNFSRIGLSGEVKDYKGYVAGKVYASTTLEGASYYGRKFAESSKDGKFAVIVADIPREVVTSSDPSSETEGSITLRGIKKEYIKEIRYYTSAWHLGTFNKAGAGVDRLDKVVKLKEAAADIFTVYIPVSPDRIPFLV